MPRPARRSPSAPSNRCRNRRRTWSIPRPSLPLTAPTPHAGSCCRTRRPSATSNGRRAGWRARTASCRECGGSCARSRQRPAATAKPQSFGPEAEALRRAAHRSTAAVTAAIEKLRFNTAVAQIYELANALSSGLQKRGTTTFPRHGFRLARSGRAFGANRLPHGAPPFGGVLGRARPQTAPCRRALASPGNRPFCSRKPSQLRSKSMVKGGTN